MDKEKLKKYQIFSTIFTAIFGTLFHFTYEWSGKNQIVVFFSAVNESTWEHLKLLYFPMLLTIIIGLLYFKNFDKKIAPIFICAKTIGIITAMAFTVVFFYTYSGIIGKDIPFISILSFFIAIILGEYVAYLLMTNNVQLNKNICIAILAVLLLCFIIFTFNPPKIGLFKDPLTNSYGIGQLVPGVN